VLLQEKVQTAIHDQKENKKMYDTVKIGTEFTFRREEFIFGLKDLAWSPGGSRKQAKPDETALGQIRAAGVEIINWVNDIAAAGKSGKFQKGSTTLESVTVEPGRKKHESSLYEAKKITLTLVCKGKGKFCKETWTVNFDLDPNCIELQAQPVTFAFYERHREILNYLFFRRGSCRPDSDWQTGGGGHISLDLATAFGNNLRWLQNFLVLYADAVKGENFRYDILRRSGDVGNAPFLHEIGELPAFCGIVQTFDKMPGAPIGELVHVINTEVYTEIDPSIDSTDVRKEDYPHYQAVNLEHINVDVRDHRTPESEQRVEMRRFDAQCCVEELLDELRCLFALLEESRSGKKYSMDNDGKLVLMA